MYTFKQCLDMGPGFYPSITYPNCGYNLVSGIHGLLVIEEKDTHIHKTSCRAVYFYKDKEKHEPFNIEAIVPEENGSAFSSKRRFGPKVEVVDVQINLIFKE